MDNLGVTFKNEKERKEFFSARVKNHAELQKEINIPFTIDYSAFKKDKVEKIQHKNIVKKWKQSLVYSSL